MSITFHAKLPPRSAQTHALLIGIGDYPHLIGGSKSKSKPAANSFGLSQLSSPPFSAQAIANWLPNLSNKRAPIGTVELLVSPGVYRDRNGKRRTADLPTMANMKRAFRKWSKRTAANSKNVAIFYYCGHGLEKGAKTILLPCDFGDPGEANLSANMVDFDTTYVCNLFESAAGTQLYFVDACRETPTDLLALMTSPTALISTMKSHLQSRDAPIINASNSGWKAHGTPKKPSFFAEALLDCLEKRKMGARGQNGERWEVSTSSLGQAMKLYMPRMKRAGVPPLVCDVGGQSNFDTVIHTFPGPAYVMSTIDCDPDAALPVARFSIRDGGAEPILVRRKPAPEVWEVDLIAGSYDIEASFAKPPYHNKVLPQLMHPPFTPCTVEVDK